MQDKLNDFLNKVHAGVYNVNHRPDEVEVEDSSAFDQCYDLFLAWCDFLGIPRSSVRHQYAHEIWDKATDETRKYFDLFPNTLTFVPQVADVAVFGAVNGIPVGHVSLVLPGTNVNDLISEDQNWDTIHYYRTVMINGVATRVPYTRTVIHAKYYGVVGFLRAKNISTKNWDDIVNQMKNALNGGGKAQDKATAAVKIFNS